jgi:hypothetical protein
VHLTLTVRAIKFTERWYLRTKVPIRGQCYDFKKYFAIKLAFYCSNYCQVWPHIVFSHWKSQKIAVMDHNIGPWLESLMTNGHLRIHRRSNRPYLFVSRISNGLSPYVKMWVCLVRFRDQDVRLSRGVEAHLLKSKPWSHRRQESLRSFMIRAFSHFFYFVTVIILFFPSSRRRHDPLLL